MNKVNALSLFSGIGGFEVGMGPLGFNFRKTLEWDKKCCETINQNIDNSALNSVPTDITLTLPDQFYQGEVDYIVGGPPCQSFSAAGRRAGGVKGINDTRGSLFWYYCQYVKHFSPKAFVFENVRGILSSKNGEDFKIICKSFQDVGYKLYWRVLNAADYGVPQKRERLFLVGVRDDLPIQFKFPLPTHGPNSPDQKPYVTVGSVLNELWDKDELISPYGGKYGHLLPGIPPGENYRVYTEEMGHTTPLFAWRSKFSGFLYKLSPDDLCKTIVAYQSRYDGPFHWNNRKCTVQELKRLQGFPDGYVIPHPYSEAVKQIGNSVSPPVAAQIGKSILMQIEGLEEYSVPLIDTDQISSVDSGRRDKANKSKAKIKVRYQDIRQDKLFEDMNSVSTENQPFEKTRIEEDTSIRWVYQDGILKIELTDNETKEGITQVNLRFYGGVTSLLKSIEVKCWSALNDESAVSRIWSEIHHAIQELTSYESLQPLYGHFTEPYPKFDMSFESNLKTQSVYFQSMAFSKETLNKISSYEMLLKKYGEPTELLKSMRQYGFDVRTHNTNRTIPEQHFRICYPFTLPKHLKNYILWTDKLDKKRTDFNIKTLTNS